MSKKIIVTGGLGFIGSNLIELLLQKKYFVINIDKVTYSSNFYNVKNFNSLKNYRFIKCDIGNKKRIKDIFFKYKPKCIFNLAAESHVDRSIDNPKNFIQSNIVGVYNLLENFKLFSKKYNSKLIHISTDEVFGDVLKGRTSENYPYNPSSPYAASKAASDHLVSSYMRTYKIPAIVTNCSNNYGPYQHIEKFIPRQITNILSDVKPKLYGTGEQVRDWIHVDDHNSAVHMIIEAGVLGETYIIGADNDHVNNKMVIELICELMGKGKDWYEHVNDRPGHDMRYAMDSSKLRRDLGWTPVYTDNETGMRDGLSQTIDWYRDNQAWWQAQKQAVEAKYAESGQ